MGMFRNWARNHYDNFKKQQQQQQFLDASNHYVWLPEGNTMFINHKLPIKITDKSRLLIVKTWGLTYAKL